MTSVIIMSDSNYINIILSDQWSILMDMVRASLELVYPYYFKYVNKYFDTNSN